MHITINKSKCSSQYIVFFPIYILLYFFNISDLPLGVELMLDATSVHTQRTHDMSPKGSR